MTAPRSLFLLAFLVAALVGCGGEAPPASSTTPASISSDAEVSGWVSDRQVLPRAEPVVVTASLRSEALDLDGDGAPDRTRTFEALEPLSGVELPSSLR